MSTTLSYTNQKARKDHKCNFCGGVIPKGQEYQRQGIVHEGSLYTWKAHFRCLDICSELRMHDNCDEGVTEDDFYEIINEEFHKLEGEQDLKLTKFKDRLDYVCSKILKK